MGAKITGHATAAPARQCHTGAQVHTREPGYSRTCAAAILTIDADGAWPRLYERGRVGKTIPGIPTSNADLPCGRRFILQWGSYLHKYQPKHLEPKSGCYSQSILPGLQKDYFLLTTIIRKLLDMSYYLIYNVPK